MHGVNGAEFDNAKMDVYKILQTVCMAPFYCHYCLSVQKKTTNESLSMITRIPTEFSLLTNKINR